jgi:hypothetical protein
MKITYDELLDFYFSIANRFDLNEYWSNYRYSSGYFGNEGNNSSDTIIALIIKELQQDSVDRFKHNIVNNAGILASHGYLLDKQYCLALEKSLKYFRKIEIKQLEVELGRFELDINEIKKNIIYLNSDEYSPVLYECLITALSSIFDKVQTHFEKFLTSENLNLIKMEWLGTQKELAELFIELKNKGYIKEFKYNTIKACFTNTNTIHQILKPDNIDDPIYPQVYSPEYKKKFEKIEKKEKKEKK